MIDKKITIIEGQIARYMESGLPIFSYNQLLSYADSNINLINCCLQKWQDQGYIIWLKDLPPSDGDDEVICLAKFPASGSFWPQKLPQNSDENLIKVDLWGDGRFVTLYPARQIPFLQKYLPQILLLS